MNKLGTILLLLIATTAPKLFADEKPISIPKSVTIPLDQIWALDMPGTCDIHKLVKKDTERVPPRLNTLDRIVRSLLVKPKQSMPGYAVPGTPSQGVRWAMRALRHRKPHPPIPTTEDINLAFFAQVSSYRTQLLSVRRDGFDIHIEYRFVPQYSAEPQVGFALIPLGQLHAGQYSVKVHKAPMEQKYLDAGFKPVSDEQASRIVSGSYLFEIPKAFVPAPGPGKDAVVIPLDQIWARKMPGTRPMIIGMKSGNKYISEEGPLLEDLRRLLRKFPENSAKQKKPAAGFVISGKGMAAMRKAHAILMGKEKRQTLFNAGKELSLGFFSYDSTWYVQLHDVFIQGKEIRVRYQFVPHQSSNITNHFALIPLKNLKQGEYEVTYKRFPMDKKYVDLGLRRLPASIDKLICESFKFTVREKPKR